MLYINCKNKYGFYYLDIETGNISFITNLPVESYGLGIAFSSGTKYDYSTNQYASIHLSSMPYDENDETGLSLSNDDINGTCILNIKDDRFEIIHYFSSIYSFFDDKLFIYESESK